MQREQGDDLIAVDDVAVPVHGEHAVAVAVECHAEIESFALDEGLQRPQVGCTAVDVDVGAVRLVPDRLDAGAELLERLRREVGVRAVRTVDADAQPGEIGAETLEHVLEVAVRRHADLVDLAAARPGPIEQRLDLLLLAVGQLLAVPVEELDAVVLGRVVRRGDDAAEVERQQCDRGRRQHTGDDRVPARRRDPPRQRRLELDAGRTRVTPHEDAPAAGPERRRTAEALDEVGCQVLADNATDAVRAEVLPRHG